MTPLAWIALISATAIVPAGTGSSPKYSKLRPRGRIARQIHAEAFQNLQREIVRLGADDIAELGGDRRVERCGDGHGRKRGGCKAPVA